MLAINYVYFATGSHYIFISRMCDGLKGKFLSSPIVGNKS